MSVKTNKKSIKEVTSEKCELSEIYKSSAELVTDSKQIESSEEVGQDKREIKNFKGKLMKKTLLLVLFVSILIISLFTKDLNQVSANTSNSTDRVTISH